MIKRILDGISRQIRSESDAKLRRKLMLHEAKVGGELFGPVPEGHTREFFCLDSSTWVWHEEWKENGQTKMMTTRYDIRPDGVLKSQNGEHYKPVSESETDRLIKAAKLYNSEVKKQVYNFV